MYLYFLRTLRPLYTHINWIFDCACGLAQSTVERYFPNIRKAVGYIHMLIHEGVRAAHHIPFIRPGVTSAFAWLCRAVRLVTALCSWRAGAARWASSARRCGQTLRT
jgi:hypothetical protein